MPPPPPATHAAAVNCSFSDIFGGNIYFAGDGTFTVWSKHRELLVSMRAKVFWLAMGGTCAVVLPASSFRLAGGRWEVVSVTRNSKLTNGHRLDGGKQTHRLSAWNKSRGLISLNWILTSTQNFFDQLYTPKQPLCISAIRANIARHV